MFCFGNSDVLDCLILQLQPPSSASGEQMQFSILISSPCQFNEIYFELLLLTDGKGDEVSWMLTESSTDTVVLSGDGYSSYSQTNIAQCLPANCYTFWINDLGGDGMCCDYGYGGFYVQLNGLRAASGNDYGNQYEVDLPCLLTPTASPSMKVSSLRH